MPICRAGRFWETYPQEFWNLFSETIFLNFSNVHCHEPQSKADAFQKNIENDVSMFLFFGVVTNWNPFFSSKGTKFRGGVIEGILDFSPQKNAIITENWWNQNLVRRRTLDKFIFCSLLSTSRWFLVEVRSIPTERFRGDCWSRTPVRGKYIL